MYFCVANIWSNSGDYRTYQSITSDLQFRKYNHTIDSLDFSSLEHRTVSVLLELPFVPTSSEIGDALCVCCCYRVHSSFFFVFNGFEGLIFSQLAFFLYYRVPSYFFCVLPFQLLLVYSCPLLNCFVKLPVLYLVFLFLFYFFALTICFMCFLSFVNFQVSVASHTSYVFFPFSLELLCIFPSSFLVVLCTFAIVLSTKQ